MTAGKGPILMIVENLPVPLDRRMWQEASALRDMGYEVIVICPMMHNYTKAEEMLDGIQIYRHKIHLEARGFMGYFLEYSSALWGEAVLAWRAFFRHRFKVVHLANPPDLLFLVALPFKLLGVKVVYDVHDLCPEMYEAKFGKRGLFYWILRASQRLTYATANVVLATNETNKKVALTAGRKAPEKVFVVRSAPKIYSAPRQPNLALKKGRKYLVGYVGVMGSADGVHTLLEAAAHLIYKMGRRDIQFLLMGSGPEYDALVELRDRLKLAEFADMPGWAYDDFLFPALATIDLGVTCDPPNSYNHSCTMNKVLEYMAFGKPQVTFDLVESRGSAADAAVYVKEYSVTGLAEAIAQTLDDPAGREQMGRRGAERLHHELNWERSVEQLRRAYDTVLS